MSVVRRVCGMGKSGRRRGWALSTSGGLRGGKRLGIIRGFKFSRGMDGKIGGGGG